MKRSRIGVILAAAITVLLTACSGGPSATSAPDFNDYIKCPDGGTRVFAAVSSEKVNLVARLSEVFQTSDEARALPNCVDVIPMNVASGEAARLLSAGWPLDETDQAQPTIWSPASTSWTNQVAASKGASLVADPVSFARSPLVFAMPEQMARTLGWPEQPIGYQTLHDLCLDPQGWGRYGGSATLWGGFKLAKTNPFTSTSGLNTLLGQAYAASGKQADLTEADIAASEQFSREFEQCVIHYGNTTGNVLDRLYERDQDGFALDYVSAVAVEETSVINYNLGNPTSRVVRPGDQLVPPQKKLVAIYPPEGSLESDNPLVVLGPDATWITPEQRTAALAFQKFVTSPAAQALLGDFGFRPVDPAASLGGLFSLQNGVDPTQPAVRLPNPSTAVTAAAQQAWNVIRKPSSVLMLIDTSGSMGETTATGRSRMDEAISSAQNALNHFRSSDELGVWAFTTGISSSVGTNVADIYPVQSGPRETLSRDIAGLSPGGGTPMYDAIATAYNNMKGRAQPGRINAIILLSDGEDTDSQMSLDQLTAMLRGDQNAEGGREDTAPVRIFPIIYSQSAPPEALTAIAEASGGQVFNASDPRRINLVLQEVVNNF